MKSDLMSGIFWLLFSVFATVGSYRLGLGNLAKPGSGLLPFAASCVLGLLSLTLALQALRSKRAKGEALWPTRTGWLKVILVLVSILIYATALEKLGFPLSTFLLLLLLLKTIEPQPWLTSILFPLLVVAAAYVVFNLWLKVPLPSGLLGLIGQ
jgi:putative tricarboxylic transport membrane protein